MIHLYTGSGKGKTTTAAGLAARSCGHGGRVAFLQFLKDGTSGEVLSLAKLGVWCRAFGVNEFIQTEIQKQAAALKVAEGLRLTERIIDEYDLVVLDELCVAVVLGLCTEKEVLALMQKAPCELVITGRGATAALINAADYVSEIKEIKHPFNEGVSARRGIEY